MLMKFRSFPAVATVTFTCALCGKPRRQKTFRAECTVNPFNTHADGTPRSPSEVLQQSRDAVAAERAPFMCKPVCSSCNDGLSYMERTALREERLALMQIRGK